MGLAAIITIVWVACALSYEKPTHRYLNEWIAERVIDSFSLNDYLVNQLGFSGGIGTILKDGLIKKNVVWWLGEGGEQEDVPGDPIRLGLNIARNNNHYHNPLGGPWEYSGLDAYIAVPAIPPLLPFPLRLHYRGNPPSSGHKTQTKTPLANSRGAMPENIITPPCLNPIRGAKLKIHFPTTCHRLGFAQLDGANSGIIFCENFLDIHSKLL